MEKKEITENDIKKILYKEKPTAVAVDMNLLGGPGPYDFKDYETETSLGKIYFRVPESDMGTTEFLETMPAQLLNRWIKSFPTK